MGKTLYHIAVLIFNSKLMCLIYNVNLYHEVTQKYLLTKFILYTVTGAVAYLKVKVICVCFLQVSRGLKYRLGPIPLTGLWVPW